MSDDNPVMDEYKAVVSAALDRLDREHKIVSLQREWLAAGPVSEGESSTESRDIVGSEAELRDKLAAILHGTVSYDQEQPAVDLMMAVIEAHHHCASCDMHACGDLDHDR